MLPLAAYCKAVRATCNTARSLALASNVCMVRPLQLSGRLGLHHLQQRVQTPNALLTPHPQWHQHISQTLETLTLDLQDEDLMPHAFGMDVDDHFVTVGGSTKCLAALSLAEDRLGAGPPPAPRPADGGGRQSTAGGAAAQVSQSQGQLAGGQQQQMAVSAAQGDQQVGQALRAALQARLRFRRQFHQVGRF